MTNAEIIDTVLLSVGGGKLSADMNVMREDVLAMIAPTAIYLMTGNAWNRKAASRQDLSAVGLSQPLDMSMGRNLMLTPVNDAARSLYYVDIPGVIVPLPGSDGVFFVSPKSGLPYIKASSMGEVRGLCDIAETGTFWWLEKNGTSGRVYFLGLADASCQVSVFAATIDTTDENSEPGVPKDLEVPLIEKLIEHFMRQRGNPADLILDGKDLNEK